MSVGWSCRKDYNYTFFHYYSTKYVLVQGRITIYTDDTSGHYRSDFVIETTCSLIDNMFMVPMEEKHVLIYACKDDQGNSSLEALDVVIEEIELGKENSVKNDNL